MILGIGTDMVEIDRIQSAIEKNPRFLQRVYTMQEIESCQRKSNCWQSFAARFAAKEAVSKAFGTGLGQIGFTEIEIKNMAGGQPQVLLHGAAQALARERNVQCVHISLSHSKAYAIATAVLEGE